MPSFHPRMFMRGINAPPGGGLSAINDISRLSPFVTRILGKNPSAFTLQGTNTYLVGAPNAKARVLIDTGDAFSSAAYTPLLLKAMRELNVSNIAAIILTHHHADHVGGVHAVLKALSQKDSSAKQEPVPVFKMKFPGDDATFVDVNDGDILHTDGTLKRNGTTVAQCSVNPNVTLRFLHTPGHTEDHISLLLEEEQSIFTGDCVLGESTPVFSNLPAYMRSLERLCDEFDECKRRRANGTPATLYPSHGKAIDDGAAHVRRYIVHRNQRDEDVLKALDTCPNRKSTPWNLTSLIDQGRPLPVRLGAVGVLLQHIKKLEGEGKVRIHPARGIASYVAPEVVTNAALVEVERL